MQKRTLLLALSFCFLLLDQEILAASVIARTTDSVANIAGDSFPARVSCTVQACAASREFLRKFIFVHRNWLLHKIMV
jgi:hypothetical protein